MMASSSSATIKSGIVSGRIPNSVSLVSGIVPANNDEEQIVLPLPEGVLTKSIGIPIIVVITKVDFNN